jgi:poly(A) polymerase
VRFIGDPAERIAEDALRILRFFRFHAWYGGDGLDSAGLAASAALAGLIDRLSGERVRDELFKLLRASQPTPTLAVMADAPILGRILPAGARTGDLDRLTTTERALGLDAAPVRRLAALTGPLAAEDLERLKTRLRLSNRDAEHLAAIIAPAPGVASLSEAEFARALYGAGRESLMDAALVSHARSGRPDMATLVGFLLFSVDWVRPGFPLTGADIVARGIKPGPAVGGILAELEDWWAAADFAPDRAECLAQLDRRLTS